MPYSLGHATAMNSSILHMLHLVRLFVQAMQEESERGCSRMTSEPFIP